METGVAKMNTVTVAAAAEPHLVTTVTNNTSTRGNDTTGNQVHSTATPSSYNVGVPTLVTNGMIGGGQTNLAGPQVEEEDKMEGGMSGGEDSRLNLLNSSPDEHEPLLRREQLPAESKSLPHLHHHHHQSRPGNILSGRGSNSNNNNNRLALGSEVKIQGLEVKPEEMKSSEVSQGRGTTKSKAQLQPSSQQISASPTTAPVSSLENKILLSSSSGPAPSGKASILKTPPSLFKSQGSNTSQYVQKALIAEPLLSPEYTQSPNDHLLHSAATSPVPGILVSQAQDPDTSTSSSKDIVLDTLTLDPKASTPEGPVLEAPDMNPTASPREITASETEALKSQGLGTTAPGPEASSPQLAVLQGPKTQGLLQPQMGQAKARRPERPCSLDLSSSCTSSGKSRFDSEFDSVQLHFLTYTLPTVQNN